MEKIQQFDPKRLLSYDQAVCASGKDSRQRTRFIQYCLDIIRDEFKSGIIVGDPHEYHKYMNDPRIQLRSLSTYFSNTSMIKELVRPHRDKLPDQPDRMFIVLDGIEQNSEVSREIRRLLMSTRTSKITMFLTCLDWMKLYPVIRRCFDFIAFPLKSWIVDPDLLSPVYLTDSDIAQLTGKMVILNCQSTKITNCVLYAEIPSTQV